MTSVSAISTSERPRFIDPKASPAEQLEQLKELMRNPPENSRRVTFTPKLASLILDTLNVGGGKGNRKFRPARIQRFAASMSNRTWMLTGDTVKFTRQGLVDGQNRLAACVRSNIPFTTHVVFGIDPECFAVVDTGAGRTNNDTLQTYGVTHHAIVAAAVRWLMIGPERGISVENKELLKYYIDQVDHQLMDRCVENAREIYKSFMHFLPAGNAAYALYLFEKKDPKMAKRVISDMLHPKGRANARSLYNRYKRIREVNLGRIHEGLTNALLILMWNDYRAGRRTDAKKLHWDGRSESFPQLN